MALPPLGILPAIAKRVTLSLGADSICFSTDMNNLIFVFAHWFAFICATLFIS
ncbi:hypothetical protein [Citrobacter sp. MGH106]|uniref:hypothetical protein n=1 Tax=Citrobacter sp. MGH106 TaxID=1686381 RepID=UPI0018CD8E19|nr:hypothetical protein [Citrobacter sp. MGH106]